MPNLADNSSDDASANASANPPTVDELKQLATDILARSHKYFTEFIPNQMGIVNGHIDKVNDRLGSARDSNDLQRLTVSLRSLHQTQSEMLERSTVVFMASYRPMLGLINDFNNQTPQGRSAPESSTNDATVNESANGDDDDWELNSEQLENLYKPYEDNDPEDN
jgi:hypothetical protein